MYNVFYVEDEFLARKYAKESSVWKTGKYNLCGMASNGKEAWEQLQNIDIDILITDIRMPFMDGLELCKLVRDQMPHIKIIILSGHTDFDYAKKALRIGVTDYQLKPLKSDDLLAVMDGISEQIDQERTVASKLNTFDQLRSDSLRIQRIKLLDDLASGIFSESDVLNRFNALDLHFQGDCFVSAVIEMAGDLNDDEQAIWLLDIKNQISDYVQERTHIHYFTKNNFQHCLIYASDDAKGLMDFSLSSLKIIEKKITDETAPANHVIGVGQVHCGLKGIAASFSEALLLLEHKSVFSDASVLTYEDSIHQISASFANSLSFNNELLLVKNLLYYGSESDITSVITALEQKMTACRLSYDFLIHICKRLMDCAEDFLDGLGERESKYKSDNDSCLDEIKSSDWIREVRSAKDFTVYYEKIITALLRYRDKKKNFKYANVIETAKEYIKHHYMEPELRLSNIAEHVSLSESYFSTLFRQEEGLSCIEYITAVRIDKAKELLKTTSKLTTEIAFEVGYQDSNYFSKIFKKATSMSPRTFKKN